MAGEWLQSLGQIAGALGVGWRCRHCNQLSNEYTGNIIDGTSRCPNCGLDPNPFAGEYAFVLNHQLIVKQGSLEYNALMHYTPYCPAWGVLIVAYL